MDRPIFKPIGTPVEQLDTPSLVVDIDILDQNIKEMHSYFSERKSKLRPHVEVHRSPAIAHKQIQSGGTVGGIAVTTLGQAEVFCQNGFSDVFIINNVVTEQKINRLCNLARQSKITIPVDSSKNADDLSKAALDMGVKINVVLNINSRLDRFGVQPGPAAVELATIVRDLGALDFDGLVSNECNSLDFEFADLEEESRRCIEQLLSTKRMMEKAGIKVRVVGMVGTPSYELIGSMEGVTDIITGSYSLMDERHREYLPQFQPAAKIMSSVTGIHEGLIVTDSGRKAVGADFGMPAVNNMPGAECFSLSAEHGRIRVGSDSDIQKQLGDIVWLTPRDIGTCVNLHDYIHVVRNGVLEAVWGIPARGHYR